jgi:hypothetical protein
MYWRLALSLAWYRFDRFGRGRRWLRASREAWNRRRIVPALSQAVAGTAIAPEVAFYVAIYPPLRDRARGIVRGFLDRLAVIKQVSPQTEAYLSHTDAWNDGWVGPRLVLTLVAGAAARTIRVAGRVELKYLRRPQVLSIRVNGEPIGEVRVTEGGEFARDVPLSKSLAPGVHAVEIESATWYVPHHFMHNNDFRPLAWRMADVSIHGDAALSE